MMSNYLNTITAGLQKVLGQRSNSAHSGVSTGAETVVELVRQINDILVSTSSTLFFGGYVTAAVDTTHTTIGALIGLDDNFFYASQYYQIVIYTTDGLAPIGEAKAVTAFDGTLGKTTHGAVSVACGVGDYCVIIHETLYETWLNTQYLYAVADGGTTYPTKVIDNSILGILMTKQSGGDISDFNNSTDSLEAISDQLATVPASGGTVSWNATALAAIEGEAEDALEGERLDHLLATTDGATSTLNASNVADGSIIAKLASKGANGATPENFNCTTDSLEAISDRMLDTGTNTFNATALQSIQDECEDALEGENLDHLLTTTDGATSTLNSSNVADGSIIAKLASKTANGAAPENFNCETDSLEAIADAVGTVDGYFDVPTADAATDATMRDVIGRKTDTASYTTVDTDSLMSYLKGLVNVGIAAVGQVNDVAPATTDFDTTLTEASNGHYNGQLMTFITGSLQGQSRIIEDYIGASKNCDFTALSGSGWTEAPADDDWFVISPYGMGYALYSMILAANNSGTVVTNLTKVLCSMDFWSAPVEEVSVDGDAGTLAAITTTVVAEVPGTFVRVIGMFKFRAVENTYAGVNKLDGATVAATSQVIQIDDAATTGYVDCITFVDDMFTLAASTREGGDVIIGSTDVAARVDGNDTYTWRWLLSKADQDDINFNDVQFGLRIWYSI